MIEVLWTDNYKNGKIVEKLFNAAADEMNKSNLASECVKKEFSDLKNPETQEYIKSLVGLADMVSRGTADAEFAEEMVRADVRKSLFFSEMLGK